MAMKTTCILLFGLGLAVAGCGETFSGVQDAVNTDIDRSNAALERFGQRENQRAGGAQVSDGIFVAARPQRDNSAALLPDRMQRPDAVTLTSRDPLDLAEIATRLKSITGISHILILGPRGVAVSGDGPVPVEGQPLGQPGEDGATTGSTEAQSIESSDVLDIRTRVNLKGSLAEVLDEIAAVFEVEWSYTEDRVVFRDYITRQYQLSALPSTSSSSTAIGDYSSSIETNQWEEISQTLEGLSGSGTQVSLSASSGLVTVTAPLGDHDAISRYIEKVNSVLGTQINFDVNVLTVSLEEGSSLGIDLSAAFKNPEQTGFSYSGTGQLAEQVGTVNIGVIDGNVSVQAMVNALSSRGKVAVDTRTGATTSNNRSVPVQITDTQAFVSEIAIEEGEDDDNDTRSITTDEIETGFRLNLFPRVLNSRELMVQYTLELSELRNIETFESDGSTVQLPEVSETAFEQQAVLKNGETLVLTGFERTRNEVTDRRGFGLLAAGGTKNVVQTRVATVIMIRPTLLKRQSSVLAR